MNDKMTYQKATSMFYKDPNVEFERYVYFLQDDSLNIPSVFPPWNFTVAHFLASTYLGGDIRWWYNPPPAIQYFVEDEEILLTKTSRGLSVAFSLSDNRSISWKTENKKILMDVCSEKGILVSVAGLLAEKAKVIGWTTKDLDVLCMLCRDGEPVFEKLYSKKTIDRELYIAAKICGGEQSEKR